jgi:predicted amidohydrolase
MSEITAGCYQFEVSLANPQENLSKVEKALPYFAEQGCNLLVLPEMWSCGFAYPQLKAMAEATPSILAALKGLARRFEMVLVGSLPETDGESVFNTSYVVDASGLVAGAYRKIHLFTPTGEDDHFKGGETPVVCSTGVGRIGLMICYDLRFPELARRLALEGAQFLCIPALWPAVRVEHWSLLLRSRALENQLFVIGCNGSGGDGTIDFGGASAVVSPTGQVLAEAGDTECRLIARGLQLETMEAFRRQIPCFNDRRPGLYKVF